MPVPLHPGRWVERGFNQAEVIAKAISEWVDLPVSLGLQRDRATPFQARLSRSARRQNVQGRFLWDSRLATLPEVILVDDVFTTGATLVACAAALRRAGTQRVFALTLFRARPW